MAKNRKNGILLLVLCAVLAGGLALYMVLPQKSEDKETDSSTEEITVDQIDGTSIASLVVEKEGKEAYSVQKKGDAWQFTDREEIPLDQDTVSGLFGCLNPVTASRIIQPEKDQELAQYGLENPAMTIRISTSAGTDYQYKLGAAVPITGGYYGMTASGSSVYCLSEELYNTFDIEKNSLIQMEELPEINASNITRIQVKNKNGGDFEAARRDDDETWEMTKPQKKTLSKEDTAWDTVKGYFTALSYESLAEYQAEKLSEYGLKDPSSVITVTYYEDTEGADGAASGTSVSGEAVSGSSKERREYKTLQLCIGNSCEEGYYVCEKGSSNVYLMDEESVDYMTDVEAYGLG